MRSPLHRCVARANAWFKCIFDVHYHCAHHSYRISFNGLLVPGNVHGKQPAGGSRGSARALPGDIRFRTRSKSALIWHTSSVELLAVLASLHTCHSVPVFPCHFSPDMAIADEKRKHCCSSDSVVAAFHSFDFFVLLFMECGGRLARMSRICLANCSAFRMG